MKYGRGRGKLENAFLVIVINKYNMCLNLANLHGLYVLCILTSPPPWECVGEIVCSNRLVGWKHSSTQAAEAWWIPVYHFNQSAQAYRCLGVAGGVCQSHGSFRKFTRNFAAQQWSEISRSGVKLGTHELKTWWTNLWPCGSGCVPLNTEVHT